MLLIIHIHFQIKEKNKLKKENINMSKNISEFLIEKKIPRLFLFLALEFMEK